MDGENHLSIRDVKSIALGRFKRKNSLRTSIALAVLVIGLLAFGMPAWILSIDVNTTRVYESQWGEEVVVSGGQVTIEGMVLERVDEPRTDSNKVVGGTLVAFLILTIAGTLGYLIYLVYEEPKFVNNFIQKWLDDLSTIPEEDLK